MKHSIQTIRSMALAMAASLPLALDAAPFVFADADLLFAVQAVSDQGTSQNVFFNLGNTVTIKGSPNQGVVGNINADLVNTFGSDWFDRDNLYFGVFGNRSNLSATFEPGGGSVEPGRVIYLASQTNVPGSAGLRPTQGQSSLGTGATNYAGLRTILTAAASNNLEATASGATILDEVMHPVQWNNSWSKWNPTPGAAFGVFTGGVQNVLGQVGKTEIFVDVQRMEGGVPTTYVATVGINSTGQIRVFTAVTATPYATWAASYPALDTEAKRLPSADPDGDGLTNLMEFVLNGNPTIADTGIVPVLNAAGNDFVFSFNRRVDSITGTTLRFQYGSDLNGWTDVAIGATGGTVGSATVAVVSSPGNPDAVTVTVPKTVAPGGTLFGRLSASQP